MANYRAGSAYISITPSMRGFNEKVRAEVAKIRDVKINVDVDVPNKPVTVPTHDPTIRPKVDNSRAFRAIASLESRLDRLARGRFLINLGVAMAPLAIPAIAAGGAGALGLGAVGAVAGGGAIGFAAIAKAQIDKLKLQQKAMGKAQQALQQAQSLSPTTKAGAASKAAQVAEAKKNLTGL